MIKNTKNDKAFGIVNAAILAVVLFLEAYPLYFVLIASFSSPNAINLGEVWLWPKDFTLMGYKFIVQSSELWTGYKNTIILTVVGTCLNLFVTFTGAYALTKSKLPGIRIIMFLLTFTMFFHGGLIPSYILVSKLGLRNSLWALIIPQAASMYNIILVRTYFQCNIPAELTQAAKIDGCSEFRLFASIVMPLSAPITATMAMFYGVAHWNEFFGALIYLSKKELFPLQLILREMLILGNEGMTELLSSGAQSGGNAEYISQAMQRTEILKYGVIIFASLPILVVYPFLQRYFVKGIMAGSLKG